MLFYGFMKIDIDTPVRKLPLSVELKINELEREIEYLKDELEAQRKANHVIQNMSWMEVDGPDKKGEVRRLFLLDKNLATPAVSLYYGDIILIGRRKGSNRVKNGNENARKKRCP